MNNFEMPIFSDAFPNQPKEKKNSTFYLIDE